jgi:hypothetical protein
MGVSGLLTMRIPFHGSWSYDRRTQILTIETTTAVTFGQQQDDTIRIRTTGREEGAISGQDLAGRKWTLWRVAEPALPLAEDARRQEIRDGFRKFLESAKDSPVFPVVLAAVCLGMQERHGAVAGLPTEEARRVIQAKGKSELQAAFRNFVQKLKQGGWIT